VDRVINTSTPTVVVAGLGHGVRIGSRAATGVWAAPAEGAA
jgi:hypothetical protein